MVKKILGFIFLLFTFTFLPSKALADGEFATSYDVLYDVSESGITTVTEKITLKNLTSEYYANEFKLTIGTTQIFDVKAQDPGGDLAVTTEQKDTVSSFAVKFNQQVVGLDKTMPWTLTFKSKDFAEKVGKVWEVRVPRISSTTNLEEYKLTLSVPQSFGQPSLISPTPKSQTASSGKILLVFDKDQLKSSGISANFGSFQIFDFDLSYHLENENLVPVLTNIALPPDTAYQDVIFQRIEPKPINVTVDSDGNYLAWYKINRREKINIKVFGSAKLYTKSKVKNPGLDEELKKKYTQAETYWEKDNPQIISKLSEILGNNPPGDPEKKVKLIYQYVVNFLKYDYNRLKEKNIERFGAVTVLSNADSAVCMEFTDLFIALVRAAGIPARELDGFAYAEDTALRPVFVNKDVLHAWPEYWSEKRGWVMVDPTWEHTTGGADYFNKLDLNHFVFAVKGLSSKEPIPAGSYKFAGQDSHDVKVSLSDNDFLGKPQIDVLIDVPNPILSGFNNSIKIKITNIGNAVYPSASFVTFANNLLLQGNDGQKTGLIPSSGNAEFNYNIRTKSLFDSYNDQIKIKIKDSEFTKDITVRPFIIFQPAALIIAGFAGVTVLIYLVVLAGHIYQKKRIKNQTNKL